MLLCPVLGRIREREKEKAREREKKREREREYSNTYGQDKEAFHNGCTV